MKGKWKVKGSYTCVDQETREGLSRLSDSDTDQVCSNVVSTIIATIRSVSEAVDPGGMHCLGSLHVDIGRFRCSIRSHSKRHCRSKIDDFLRSSLYKLFTIIAFWLFLLIIIGSIVR